MAYSSKNSTFLQQWHIHPKMHTCVWYWTNFDMICQWSTHFCLILYWSSELPITLRLKDGVYGEAGNNFSLRQSLFEHQTAPHFYDKIKSPAFLHIYYIQLLKLQIRVPKKISFECWIRNFKADHDSSPINLHPIFWYTKHRFPGFQTWKSINVWVKKTLDKS